MKKATKVNPVTKNPSKPPKKHDSISIDPIKPKKPKKK